MSGMREWPMRIDVSFAAGLQESRGEQGFVVFHAGHGQENQAGEKKEQTGHQRHEVAGQAALARIWRVSGTIQL